MTTVTVSSKFQVVIPPDVCQRMHLQPGTKLQVVEFNGGLWLLPVQSPSEFRGIARGMDTTVVRNPDRVL